MIPAREYVVVGASGILAPLGQVLRSSGARTLGVSRGERLEAGSWDERVALDTQDARAISSWGACREARANELVAYSPAVGAACWGPLSAVAERLVVVATTEWVHVAPKDRPWAHLEPRLFQLGWVETEDGTRWHTPQEISDAVGRALAEPWPAERTVVLGETTPWASRPGV